MEQHWELAIWTPSPAQWWPSPHLQHQQHTANLGPRNIWGGSFAESRKMQCTFPPGKNQLQWRIFLGTRVHSLGQWHRAWQGHRCGTQLSLAVCLSPPTATCCGQQGSFPPFRVSGMWLEGLRPKGRYKPVFPHPPAASRGPEAGTAPGPVPPPVLVLHW